MSSQNLFPSPSRAPSTFSSSPWPGKTPGSGATLKRLLEENHEKWHIYFNARGFHNHISHRLLALWDLGADEEVMKAAYERDKPTQRASFASPEAITGTNFNDHLGDEKYYNAYLQFFTDAVKGKDLGPILEEYVFSPRFNYGSKSAAGKHPEMFNRFFSGVLHPMIHCGYGLEFTLSGMIAEGLAQTAIHNTDLTGLIPPSIFSSGSAIDKTTSALKSLTVDKPVQDTHALAILARVMNDASLAVQDPGILSLAFLKSNVGEKLFEHAKTWTLNTSDPREVERKIEELQWMNTLIYAIPGFRKGKAYQADFFYMHLVTSSLFLPSFAAYLSSNSLELLLRTYLATSLALYIARGKPKLDIESFFAADTAHPDASSSSVTPILSLVSSSSPVGSNPNPWFTIIQHSIVHPDDHMCKFQRAIAHYSTLYGSKPAGTFAGVTELPGSDKIDGSLFIRAAGLTHERLARDRGGEDLVAYWDYEAFFEK